MSWNRATLSVAAAFVAALAIRVAVTIAFQGLSAPPNMSANPDQAEYEQLTYHLSTRRGYSVDGTVPTAVRPPGFTLTLLPVYELVGRSYAAARLWLILLSASTCLLAAWCAYQWGGKMPAVIAAWWLALYPGHFYYAMHFLSETVYAFWLSVAVGCTIAALRGDGRGVRLLAGVAWGLAILTRVELLVIVPGAWAFVWFERRRLRFTRMRQLMLPTLVVVALVGTWAARNAMVLHAPTLSTQRGCTFWGSHNDVTFNVLRFAGTWLNCSELVDTTHPMRGSELERDRLTLAYGVESVRRNALRLPFLEAMKVWRLASPFFETTNRAALLILAAGWILSAPFVVLGVWSTWKRHADTRVIWVAVVAPLLATLLTTLVFYGSARYRDGLAPVLLVFAAFGLIEFSSLFPRVARRLSASHPVADAARHPRTVVAAVMAQERL